MDALGARALDAPRVGAGSRYVLCAHSRRILDLRRGPLDYAAFFERMTGPLADPTFAGWPLTNDGRAASKGGNAASFVKGSTSTPTTTWTCATSRSVRARSARSEGAAAHTRPTWDLVRIEAWTAAGPPPPRGCGLPAGNPLAGAGSRFRKIPALRP